MTTDAQLTILLTLKDRGEFTRRWMSYAERVRFPFKVLIADGGADPSVSALLADRARFPNVDYEYLRFPEDTNYRQYYAKIDDALARVQTPFVAMADNDDFLLPEALAESVRFLSTNPDYAACGGRTALFWVVPGADDQSGFLYGNQVDCKVTSLQSNDAPTATERLHRLAMDFVFYDIKRIEEARRQFRLVREMELNDLFLMEYLVLYLTVISGKTKRIDRLHLARQHNSPGSSGGEHQRRFGDWMGRMLVDSWSGDFAKFVDATAGALAAEDRVPPQYARECIVGAYRKHVAPELLSNLLGESSITLPMLAVVPAIRRLVGMPEKSPLKKGLRRLYRRLKWISRDVVVGTEIFARSATTAERDFHPIREFLAADMSVQ